MRPRRLFIFLLAVALPLLADTYPRPVGYKLLHYDFNLTLTDASNEIQMQETAEFLFTADGVTSVALDLCQLRTSAEPADNSNPCLVRTPYGLRAGSGPAPNSVGRGMTVTTVTAHGAALQFTQTHDRLEITLPAASKAGDRLDISFAYHGTPANGLLIAKNKYGDREFFTNAWPDLARNWLAVVDHPAMKVAKQMTVTAPDHYQVISNGSLVETTDLGDGQRRTVWREDVPICTWQFSLGVAPMAVEQLGVFRGIPLSAWVYPQERDPGFPAYAEFTQPILQYYEDNIGPYSYEKLAQVEANGTGGGMELASDIFYGYNGGAPQRQLLAHEMAHQYFGDSATEKDWDDVWLSEGFATYFALLYQEHADGHDAFLQGVESSAAGARRYAEAHPDSPLVHNNLSNISQVIANNAQIYQGGAMVLQMLRGVLGTRNFWNGIRLYYQRFRNSNANDLDLEHAFEDACAETAGCPAEGKDLSWFFPQWLHRGGVMQVQGSWRYDESAHQLDITVDQTPNQGQLYDMPFQIGITMPPPPPAPEAAAGAAGRGGRGRGARGARPATPEAPPVIWVKAAHNTLSIPLAAAPATVTLDPDHYVPMAEISFAKQWT